MREKNHGGLYMKVQKVGKEAGAIHSMILFSSQPSFNSIVFIFVLNLSRGTALI